MSWDVLLLKTKIDITDMEAQPEAMGSREVLIEGFKRLSSNVDFSNKSWGIFFLTDKPQLKSTFLSPPISRTA